MAIVKLPFGVRVAPVGMLWRQHEPNMATQRLLASLRAEAASILNGEQAAAPAA